MYRPLLSYEVFFYFYVFECVKWVIWIQNYILPILLQTKDNIKQTVSIPIIANGDIDSAVKAQKILEYTGVDGVMIGRAAQGRPWIFEEINYYLDTGRQLAPKTLEEQCKIVKGHLQALLF